MISDVKKQNINSNIQAHVYMILLVIALVPLLLYEEIYFAMPLSRPRLCDKTDDSVALSPVLSHCRSLARFVALSLSRH